MIAALVWSPRMTEKSVDGPWTHEVVYIADLEYTRGLEHRIFFTFYTGMRISWFQ